MSCFGRIGPCNHSMLAGEEMHSHEGPAYAHHDLNFGIIGHYWLQLTSTGRASRLWYEDKHG